MNESMKDLIREAAGERSIRAVAMKAGIDASTLTRQVNGGDIPVRNLVRICRAYGLPVVPMFVRAGYITAEEASRGAIEAALETATDAELMTETLRRVQAGKASDRITAPMNVGRLTDDELRTMDLDGMPAAAGDDVTTDDEDTSTP